MASLRYWFCFLIFVFFIYAIEPVYGKNGAQVAAAINEVAAAGNKRLDPILTSLLPLTTAEQAAALNQMQPALFKGLTICQENTIVRVQNTLSYRFQQLMDETHCYRLPSMHQVRKQERAGGNKPQQTLQGWLDGFGDLLEQDSCQAGANPQVGYCSTTAGVAVGLDGRFAKRFYLGALGGYTDTGIRWKKGRSRGDIYSGYSGIYFSMLGDLMYLNTSAIGSWSTYQAKRSIRYAAVDALAKNQHGDSQLLAHVDVGINAGPRSFIVRPFDAVDYIVQSEGSFTEQGAGIYNLKVNKSRAALVRNEFGLQFSSCLGLRSSIWLFSPKISWVREVRLSGSHYTAEFINTTTSFKVSGYFPSRNLMAAGVLLSGRIQDRLSLELYYNGEFARHFNDQSFGGQLCFGF